MCVILSRNILLWRIIRIFYIRCMLITYYHPFVIYLSAYGSLCQALRMKIVWDSILQKRFNGLWFTETTTIKACTSKNIQNWKCWKHVVCNGMLSNEIYVARSREIGLTIVFFFLSIFFYYCCCSWLTWFGMTSFDVYTVFTYLEWMQRKWFSIEHFI